MSEMVKWGGAGCCVGVGAAALFFLGKAFSEDAKSLRSVTRINQLKDLSLLVDTTSIALPLIVAVSGKVRSDRPIKCETSGLECVILEETTAKLILKREMETVVGFEGYTELVWSWKEDHNEIESVNKEVPWYLDDGTDQVFVVAARRASYWKSTVRHGRCYRSQSLPITGTIDDIWGDMDLIVKTTKRVLLTGTLLTVVGEAVKDETGTIRIRQPKAGPFYVSRMNIDELTDNLGGWAWFCTRASLVLAFLGIYLIEKHAFQCSTGRNFKQDPKKGFLRLLLKPGAT